jgi:hypothetical protein
MAQEKGLGKEMSDRGVRRRGLAQETALMTQMAQSVA